MAKLPNQRKITIQESVLSPKSKNEIFSKIVDQLRVKLGNEKLFDIKKLKNEDILGLSKALTVASTEFAEKQVLEYNEAYTRADLAEMPRFIPNYFLPTLSQVIVNYPQVRELTRNATSLEELLEDITDVTREHIRLEYQKISKKRDDILRNPVIPQKELSRNERYNFNQSVRNFILTNYKGVINSTGNNVPDCCEGCMIEYENKLVDRITDRLNLIGNKDSPQIGDIVTVKNKLFGRKDVIILGSDTDGNSYEVQIGDNTKTIKSSQIKSIKTQGKISKLKNKHKQSKKLMAQDIIQEAQINASIPYVQERIQILENGFREEYCIPFEAMEQQDGNPKNYLRKLVKKAKAKYTENIKRDLNNLERSFFTTFGVGLDKTHEEIQRRLETLVASTINEISLESTSSLIQKQVTSQLKKSGLISKNKAFFGEGYRIDTHMLGEKLEQKRIRDSEGFFKVDLPKMIEQLPEDRVNPIAWEGVRYAYLIDPNAEVAPGTRILDPYRIGEEFLSDFLRIMGDYATTGTQQEKLEMARALILQGREMNLNEVRSILTKPAKSLLSSLLEETKGKQTLIKDTRAFNTFSRQDPRQVDIEELQKVVRNLGADAQYLVVRDLLMGNLMEILEQSGDRARLADYKLVWEKFRPDQYDLAKKFKESKLEVVTTRDKDLVMKGKSACGGYGACISEQGIMDHMTDLGAIYSVLMVGKTPSGYCRTYLMKDREGTPYFWVDTIEGRMGTSYNPVYALASCQLALDSNVKASISAGFCPEGFGNHTHNVSFPVKIGKPRRNLSFPGYSLRDDGINKQGYILMQNWRRE
jgi:hypothetical protein